MLAKLIKGMLGIVLVCVFMSQPWSLASIVAVLIGIGIAYIVYKIPLREHYFLGIVLLFLLFTRGVSLFTIQTPLESDFQTMYTISQEILNGAISDFSKYYMNEYTYQIPYILYQAGLLALNPQLLFLKCINGVYSVLTVLCLYSIAKKVASRGAARVITCFYAIWIFPMTYTSVISNQWSSTLFLLLGIRMVLGDWKQHTSLKHIAVGASIAIAALLRPDAIVSVLAIVAYGIYLLLQNKEKWKLYCKNILIFIVTYSMLTNGVMGIIKHTEFVTNPQSDDYLWKFVCGLNSEAQGRWNAEDFNLVYNDALSREERKQLEIEMIKERLTHTDFLSLWSQKIYVYWNQFEYFWTFGYTQEIEIFGKSIATETIVSYAKKIDKAIWGTMLILAIVGLAQKRKKAILPYIILIGTFLIYLWIEVQGRYSYYTDMLVFVVAAIGIDVLANYIHHKKKEKAHAKNKCDSTHI